MDRVIMFDARRGEWMEFSRPVEIVRLQSSDECLDALCHVESIVRERNVYAAGFLSYEAAPAFDRALHTRSADPTFPLLWFGIFEERNPLRLPSSGAHETLNWQPTISREQYRAAIGRIKHYIAEGDTYQVNFSFRLTSRCTLDPYAFFLHLVRSQPSANGAFIETPDFAVCSASPELFFQMEGETIITRPMKGTEARGMTLHDDLARGEALRTSEKNRAENVMIVDMMRNDLGRIADVGTVAVPSLFAIEKYPTVWQMTSTVTAKTTASIVEIMKALFPCCSVTGAPKARTMQIIAELETTPRKIYTGAIGFLESNRRAQFNVAIRTVVMDKRKGEAEYGTGGGVVWASTPDGEYEECLTKARVLTDARPEFELFETILFTQERGFFLLDEHLGRLRDSAAYFDYPMDTAVMMRMLTMLDAYLRRFSHDCRVRLVLHRDGQPTFAIRPIRRESVPVRVKLASVPVDSNNVFLYHKTTNRNVYDDALAAVPDCDDVLLWNERGEITESTVANVVVELDGALLTPTVSCGLLAGTFREVLLREGKIKERIIVKDELSKASRLFLVNSLREWRNAYLV